MGEAEKLSDSRCDEPAEANARPRRETAEEAPAAGPAGAGASQGTSRDIREHRDIPADIPGYSRAPGHPTEHPEHWGTPGHPREHPGHSEVLGHTVEQQRDPQEEHHRALPGGTLRRSIPGHPDDDPVAEFFLLLF